MAYNKGQKLNDNIAAIRVALQLRKDGCQANDDECAILRKYSGFGGLKFILKPADSDDDIRHWNVSEQPYFRSVRELYGILHDYSADAREEKELMASIKRSVNTAFYTPTPVIDGIAQGLKDGKIEVHELLDPSAGIGKFGDVFRGTNDSLHVTAFEKDLLTGLILKSLHPQDAVTVDGFETIPVSQKGRFDVVTSNIPFGDISVFDPEFSRFNNPIRRDVTGAIHNYFFLKALDMTRHGGLVAFITSRGVMDSRSNTAVRYEMMQKANLVAAYRLPDGMFRDEAGTEVGSDLIILQKDVNKQAHNLSARENDFVQSVETLDDIIINGYFDSHKESVITTETVVATDPYGKAAYVHKWDNSLDSLSKTLAFKVSNDIVLSQADVLYVSTAPVREEKKEEQPVKLAQPSVQRPAQVKAQGKPKVQAQSAPVQLDLFSMWDDMDNGTVQQPMEENRQAEERRRSEPRPYEGEVKPFYRDGIVIEDPATKQLGILSDSVTGQYVFTPLTLDFDQTGRMRQYIFIRDAYQALYNTEAELRVEQPELREELNRHYDNYFLRYGRLNERKNSRVIMMDGMGRDTLTLENPADRDFVKADIFDRPVSFISYEITHVDTPEEALFASLNRYGEVDLDYMEDITGIGQDELVSVLRGQIYYMPDGHYEISSKALSGNVYEKLAYVSDALELAQEHADDERIVPALQDTKAALENAIPQQIAFDDIGLQFGERWIPTGYYEDYCSKVFDTKMEIHYAEHIDEYSLKAENRYNLKIREEYCVRGEYKDYDGMALLAHAFHNTTPDIQKCIGYDDEGNDRKGPDMEKIQLAASKIDEIRDGFTEYLTNLPKEKRDELQALYNRKFNCFVKAHFDGSHQTFPGIDMKALAAPKFNVKDIYKSQKDCVWMILQNGGGICDHEVGTGKTLIMCMAAHEMHRLGVANKPMIIALKANVAEIAATYQAAFPDDKILYASEKDFSPANRLDFFNRIKNNDYACVIMSHDQFGKIPQSLDIQRQILDDEIRDIDEALDVIRQQGGNISGRMLTGLEKRKENLRVKILELQHDMASRKDDFVDFGNMGIDHIFVDESHQFKNLMFTTRHQRVSGLGNPAGSQKALNLLYAIRTIQGRTGKDLGATFLSGTTISNSLTELYLLFKYLRPEAMARQGIHSFDAWAAVYAKKTSDYEFSVTNAVVQKERFRYFVKVPELATFYNEITDYRTGEDVGLDRPDMNVQLHNIKPTADQQDFNERLVQFAQTGDGELIFRAPLSDREQKGKMLIATDASRKASLDMRLVSQDLFGDDPDNKASHCARLVSEYYQKFNEQKGTQFIFSDLSTWKPGEWNVFQEIKDKLVNDYGIPESEIRFIQEAKNEKQRKQIIQDMNDGKIRVLFGSTSTLGTGVNAQKRAVAVHHIDIPWRPSDLEQRDGRARRTGNEIAKLYANNNVDVIIYAVERTLDSYKFNLLQNKQLFITQLKTNSLGTRVIDEGAMDEENGMNFAEYVAILSGNDDLLQKAKLEKRIMALESERKTYMMARRDTEWRLEVAREKVEKNTVIIQNMTEDYDKFSAAVKRGEDGVALPGLTMKNVDEFAPDGAYNVEGMGEVLQDAGRTIGNKERQMGEVYGFPLMVDSVYMYDDKMRKEVFAGNKFYVKGHYLYEHNNGKLAMSKDNRLGAVRFGVQALEKIPTYIGQYRERNENLAADIAEYERIAGKPWGKEEDLKGLKKELEALEKKIQESLDETTKNLPKPEELPYKFTKEGREHHVIFPRDAYPLVRIKEMRELADTGSWRNRGWVRCGEWDGDLMVSEPEVDAEFTLRQKAEEFIAKVVSINSERIENLDWLIATAKEDTKGDKVCQDNEVIFAARHLLEERGVNWQQAQEPAKGIVPTQEEMETERLLSLANTKNAHTLPLSDDMWHRARLMLDNRGIDWRTGLPVGDVSQYVSKWSNARDNELILYAEGILSRGRVFHPGDAVHLTALEEKYLSAVIDAARGPFSDDLDRRDAYERLMVYTDYLGEKLFRREDIDDVHPSEGTGLIAGAEFYQQYISEHYQSHSPESIVKTANQLFALTEQFTKLPDWNSRDSVLAQMRVMANRILRANGLGGAKDIVEELMNHVLPKEEQRDLGKMLVYSVGRYGGDENGEELRTIAHQIKEYGTESSIDAAVTKLIGVINNIPDEDKRRMVLIPVPGTTGYAGYMEDVVNKLAERAHMTSVNSLFGTEHESLYDLKKQGVDYDALPDITFELDGTLPEGTIALLVDNVLDTGKTLSQAMSADYGEGVDVRALVIAHTDNYKEHHSDMEVKTLRQLQLESQERRDLEKEQKKAAYIAAVETLRHERLGHIDAPLLERMVMLMNASWNAPFGQSAARNELAQMGVDWHTGGALQAPSVQMQVVPAAVSTVTAEEKQMMGQVAMDLMTGNHLLGRPRPDGYRELMREVGDAFAAVKTLSVTPRQRDLLAVLSENYHEGFQEIASQAGVDIGILMTALSRADGVQQGIPSQQIAAQPYHIYHEEDSFVVDYDRGYGLSDGSVRQVAAWHDGEVFDRAGRMMVRFDSDYKAGTFIDHIRSLNVRYTNEVRDALIGRLRSAGIEVSTDVSDGERVLNNASLSARQMLEGSSRFDAFQQEFSTILADLPVRHHKAEEDVARFEEIIQSKYGDDWKKDLTEEEDIAYVSLQNEEYTTRPREDGFNTLAFDKMVEHYGADFLSGFGHQDGRLYVADTLAASFVLGFRAEVDEEGRLAQQQSDSFKKWFGDWENDHEQASKIVDADGRPMVLYHGTGIENNFNVFDRSKGGKSNTLAKVGFWFTPSRQFAQNWTDEVWYNGNRGSRVLSVYLDIKHPKVYRPFTDEQSREGARLLARLQDVRKEIQNINKEYEDHYYTRHFDYKDLETFQIARRNGFAYDDDSHYYGIHSEEENERAKEHYRTRSPHGQEAMEDGEKVFNLMKQERELVKQYAFYRGSDPYEQFRTDVYAVAGRPEDANVGGGIGMALNNFNEVIDQYREQLKAQGYDGIIIEDTKYDRRFAGTEKTTQYIAFDPEQIKSATQNIGTFRRNNPDIRYMLSLSGAVFISNARLAVEHITQQKATPEQWLRMIEKAGGVKAGEDRWTGLSDWLRNSQEKTLTKEQVLQYIVENQIRIEEVHYAENGATDGIPTDLQEKFRNYISEEQQSAWQRLADEHGEDYAEDVFGEIDYSRDDALASNAFKRLSNEYGDDFDIAFSFYREPGEGYFLYIENSDVAESLVDISIRPIENTRLDYTTEGLRDRREIALTVPEIEGWNDDDHIHFGDADGGRAIAWVRFGDAVISHDHPDMDAARKAVVDYNRELADKYHVGYFEFDQESFILTDDERAHLKELETRFEILRQRYGDQEKVLVIDEIQSKRHQEGRAHGYINPLYNSRLQAYGENIHRAMEERDAYYRQLVTKYESQLGPRPLAEDIPSLRAINEYNARLENVISSDEREHYLTLKDAADAVVRERNAFRETNHFDSLAVPAAPFEKNWQELAMKRMLRYAADNGYDRVAWTTGYQQADRYNIGEFIAHIDVEPYEAQTPSEVDGYDVNLQTTGMASVALYVTKDGEITSGGYGDDSDYYVGKKLSDVVGKPLSEKILACKEWQRIEGEDLRVGADGLSAFYDGILPNFINKYCKQWGVHTEDVTIPGIGEDRKGLTMHSVAVTDQMKKDVKAGQAQFFRAGDRQAYGFTHDGKIYIDPRIATAETPIHEYTHLWAAVLRQHNPEEWKNIVKMMKDTPELWNYVKDNYPALHTDDEIADEALAHFSGQRGYQRLQAFIDGKENADSIFEKITAALAKFWKGVADFFHIHFITKEEVADRVLYDLLNGVNPLQYRQGDMPDRFHFIGEKGATNLDVALDGGMYIYNLRHAEKLEKVGRSPLDIKIETGWERGTDGRWRMELPAFKQFDAFANIEWLQRHTDTKRFLDLLSKENAHLFGGGAPLTEAERQEYERLHELPDNKYYQPGTIHKNPERLTVQDYVSSPMLFMAYPGLKDMAVRIEEMDDRGAYATRKSIVDGSDVHYIRLNKDMVDGARHMNVSLRYQMESTMAHEIQHFIQEQEGFARGTDIRRINGASEFELNVAAFDGFIRGEGQQVTYDVLMSRLKDDVYADWRSEFGPGYQEMMQTLLRMSESMDADLLMKNYEYFRDNGEKGEAWTQYWHSAGEVEARNVQARMGMSIDQRRHSLAVETEDVSRERQTISYSSAIAASREVPAALLYVSRQRQYTLADREAGGAMVDHLQGMGITVHIDSRENRRILKDAQRDQSEVGKLRYFTTEAGDSYGFAYKGEIHLDLRKLDAELPLHEYAHLWCEAMRRVNPDNWKNVVAIMRDDSDTWQFVKNAYPELTDDDDLAEEVIAHYSGKRGAEKLQKELERMTSRDVNYGSRWGNIFQNVSKAIQDFWKHIGDSLNIDYVSKEDIADQILNDFAKNVNPMKKVEKWLFERDAIYRDAVENDPDLAVQLFEEALHEHIGNGITPFLAVDGYRGKLDTLAHAVKSDDTAVWRDAINEAADLMTPLVPPYSVLVPAPSHEGMATDMKALAEAISQRTGQPVADVLKSDPRASQYDVKRATGRPLSADQLGIRMEGALPDGYMPVVIDNVVHSGNTAEACVKALGKGMVLSLASATSQERHAATLKSAQPIVYDKEGRLIPLSERFELKNKYLGRVMHYRPLEDGAAFDSSHAVTIQGLEEYSPEDIEIAVEDYVNEFLAENFPDDDIWVKEVTVIGSRTRGEARADSDLDILLEYGGDDVREDTLFNALHEDNYAIEGIPVDINPINPHYSLNTADWLKRDAQWREEDARKHAESNGEHENVSNDQSINSNRMNTSVIESNLKVLAERLLPGHFDRVRFMKPQDLDHPDVIAVGGELSRREDGIHLFMNEKEVSLDAFIAANDRNEVADLYRSLLEYSIASRIGNGKGMNFPDGTVVDGSVINTAAVLNDSLRVVGSRDGSEFHRTYFITMEGLEQLDKLVEQRFNQDRLRDFDPVAVHVENYRQILLAAAQLKGNDVAGYSKLYDELNSLVNEDGAGLEKWAEDAADHLHSFESDSTRLNELTNGRYLRFVNALSSFLSEQEVADVAKGITQLRSSYSDAHVIDLYDKTVAYYNSQKDKGDLAVTQDLVGLLNAKDGLQLINWVRESGHHDNQEPLELLKSVLSTKCVYEADHILAAIRERDLAPDRQMQLERSLPKTPVEEHYAFVLSYYINNVSSMNDDEKAIFKKLDNAATAAAYQQWASEVLVGGALQGLSDIPDTVRGEMENLAYSIAEANEQVFEEETVEDLDNIGIVNEMRQSALAVQARMLKDEHPDEIILFRNGQGFSVYGDDVAAVKEQTGWEGRTIGEEGKQFQWMNLSHDGYNVLSEKELNLRVVTPAVSIRPLAELWKDEMGAALQTIDYNISFAADKPVLIDTDGSLDIDSFKVKTLDFHSTGLTAISESGETMTIRDIPTNYYHPKGTLVVADYINGHRQTIERSLEAERPVSDEVQAEQKELYASYKEVKAEHPEEVVLFRQKGFMEAFGQDAERISEQFGIPLYERNMGGEDVHFVMLPTEVYSAAVDFGVEMNLHVVAKPVHEEQHSSIRPTLARMEDSIRSESGLTGKIGAEIMQMRDGRYGVSIFDPKTMEPISFPVELSAEEEKAYLSMSGADKISMRSDFVLSMADKYFNQELKVSHNRDFILNAYDNIGLSYSPLSLSEPVDYPIPGSDTVERYTALSVDPPYIMLYETMDDAEESRSPRMLTDLPLDLQEGVLKQLRESMYQDFELQAVDQAVIQEVPFPKDIVALRNTLEVELNKFAKDQGADIPVSSRVWNGQYDSWQDVEKVASLVAEDVLRTTGKQDQSLANSTTTEYVSPAAEQHGRAIADTVKELFNNPAKQLNAQLERVGKLSEDLGLDYVPLVLRVPVTVKADPDIDWRSEDKIIAHAMYANGEVTVYDNRNDSYDDENGISLYELPVDNQREVLTLMEEMMSDQDRQISVYERTALVPDWALNTIVNGDISGLENDEMVMVEKFTGQYPNRILSPRDQSEGFLPFPEFGPGADCTKVDIVRLATPRQLRIGKQLEEQQKAAEKQTADRKQAIEAVKPNQGVPVRTTIDSLLQRDNTFRYQLLEKMRDEVKDYLGSDNRDEKALWAGNAKDHLVIMDELMLSLPEQPVWLSSEQILDYASQMGISLDDAPDQAVDEQYDEQVVRRYSDAESADVKHALGEYLDNYVSEHYSNGDAFNTDLSEAMKEYVVTNTNTAQDAVRDLMISVLNKADLNKPGILAGYGIDDVEAEAEKIAQEAVYSAESRLAPTVQEPQVSISFKKGDVIADTDQNGNTVVGRFEKVDEDHAIHYSVCNGYLMVPQCDRTPDIHHWRLATDAEREKFVKDERRVTLDKVSEKICEYLDNKTYPHDDVAIVKEAAVAFLEKYNSDYYQAKNVDIAGKVNAFEIDDRQDLMSIVAAVSYDIHSEALQRDPSILERYLPTDMTHVDELNRVSDDVVKYAEGIIDLRLNNLSDVVGSRLNEVNAMVAEYNRLSKAADPNFMFSKHTEGYELARKGENEFALVDAVDRNYVTSLLGARELLAKLDAVEQQMVEKFPELKPGNEPSVSEGGETPEDSQEQSEQQELSAEKAKKPGKWDNLDYTKYTIPDCVTVENAKVTRIPPKEGETYAKFTISADANGKHYERDMYSNDIKSYFKKDARGERIGATLDQLVAKYFGKQFAADMSIGSVQEAEHVLAEQKDAKVDAVFDKEEKARQQADKEKAAAEQEAAEEKKAEEEAAKKKAEEERKNDKKEKVPVIVLQSTLLMSALLSAGADHGRWLNKDGKSAPDFVQKGQSVSAFNALMMALHSDANGYKTNFYTTFNAARHDGYSVKGGETGLPFNWYNWDKYVNRFNVNEVINKSEYDNLPAEEKELYKVLRSKEERSIFNIDQTSMPQAKHDAYSAILDEQKVAAVNMDGESKDLKPYDPYQSVLELREKHPDAMFLMRSGDFYEAFGEDAEKCSALLSLTKEQQESQGEKYAHVAFPHHALDTYLPKIVKAGHRVAICDRLENPNAQRAAVAAAIYDKSADLENALTKQERVFKEPIFDTGYNPQADVLHFTDRRYARPGQEVATALERVNDIYRAAVAYTGSEQRLNRVGHSTMLPDDAVKYDRLVQELAAGVMMTRDGLPATLSKESLALVPYWQRELKESPRLMENIEKDVNNAVEVLNKLRNGEAVDYAAIRGEKSFEAVRPKLFTIASALATIPNIDEKQVVVVKDEKNKSAAVILPAGASLEVNNEVPGLNKNRFVIALRKEGFENVQFYNAGGALGLNQSNEFFADKTVEVAKLKQYNLITVQTVDLSEEIARTSQVDIEQVQLTRDDKGNTLLYVKPADSESFTVYAEPSDVKMFLKSMHSNDFDAVRETLGQKYYSLVLRHPDLKEHVMMPEIGKDVDISRISKINITKDRLNPNTTIIFATIDGEAQKPVQLSKLQAQRFWLVDDKDMYKIALAAQIWQEKVSNGQGQSEDGQVQFRDHHEEPGRDCVEEGAGQKADPSKEVEEKRGGIRM